MITLHGLNGVEFLLNEDHIEKIEEVPETVITLGNGKKYLVKEKNEEVVKRIIEFKKKIYLCN